MARRTTESGFSVFLGLVLLFASLFLLSWPGVSGIALPFLGTAVQEGLRAFLGGQFLYFLLGAGMGLLAAARAERALYLWLFLLFFLVVLICNLNLYWLWSLAWAEAWRNMAGLFALLLGFFFVLCARYFTLQIRIKSRSVR